MESELKDLIFEEDSTVLRTLSRLNVTDVNTEVTNLSVQVNNNTGDIVSLNQQIVTLGNTLANYQSNTNAELINLNTKIINLTSEVNDNSNEIETLNTDVENLVDKTNTQQADIDYLLNQQDSINENFIEIRTMIDQINSEIGALNDKVDDLNTQVQQITQYPPDIWLVTNLRYRFIDGAPRVIYDFYINSAVPGQPISFGQRIENVQWKESSSDPVYTGYIEGFKLVYDLYAMQTPLGFVKTMLYNTYCIFRSYDGNTVIEKSGQIFYWSTDPLE